MPDTTNQLDRARVPVVYLGVVRLAGGTLGIKFRELATADGDIIPDSRVMIFDKKTRKHFVGTPGSVYEVEVTLDRASIYPTATTYVGRFFDKERAAVWQAESVAIEREHGAKLAAKKDAKTSELIDSLSTARLAYQKAIGTNRAHILALIVEAITS